MRGILDFSLKTKILGITLGLAALLAVVGGVGWYAMRETSRKYDHVAKINLPNAVVLGQMQLHSLEVTRHALRLAIFEPGSDEFKKATAAIDHEIALYEKADKQYNEIEFVEGEQAYYDRQNADWITLRDLTRKYSALENSGERAKGHEIVTSLMPKARVAHSVSLGELIEFQDKEAQKWTESATLTALQGNRLTAIFVIAGFLIACLGGFVFSSRLSRTLREVTSRISDSATQSAAASQQLSAASQQLSSGASQSAAALEETVSSMEELSSIVRTNADNAKEAGNLSEANRTTAEKGEQEIQQLITAMGDMANSSKRIAEITNVIDDISFQTNLLALNAAVEAARAGEQGKGFAVVAEAVRNLAARSASAAKDIASLIQESVHQAEHGSKVADQSGIVLKNIVSSAQKIASLNSEIAAASNQQATGIAQISKALNQLDQSTQMNASTAEEAAASSEELSAQADQLKGQVQELLSVIDGAKSTEIPFATGSHPGSTTGSPAAKRDQGPLALAS